VGVWTDKDSDEDVGEAARKPTGWQASMKRAGSAEKSLPSARSGPEDVGAIPEPISVGSKPARTRRSGGLLLK
jgi:hypothetical protein